MADIFCYNFSFLNTDGVWVILCGHSGSLLLRHGVFLACEWRIGPPDREGSCGYVEWATAESRQWVFLQFGGLGMGLTTPHRKDSLLRNVTPDLGLMNTVLNLQVP